MANCCSYDMRVVGESKESVLRMRKILGYEDKEFFLYRVMDMTQHEKPKKDGAYWRLDFFGDVAWGPDPWIYGIPDPNNKSETGAHYSNLPEICKALKVGVEVWAQEFGNACQWHFIVNPAGEVPVNESYSDLSVEDDGEGNEKLVGGFDDGFLKWSPAEDIIETFGAEDDGED